MPTGYTADVQSGEVTELSEFALQCARNFGALILMRDEPHGTPIPDEFKPSQHNNKRLEELYGQITQLRLMTPDELQAACDEEHRQAMERHEQQERERLQQKGRYEAMLAMVDAWVPPSLNHHGLKKFMQEQLQSSIDWDCCEGGRPPEAVGDGEVWQAKKLSSLYQQVEWARKHQLEEDERTAERNLWVRQLRESLCRQSVEA